MQRDLLLPSSTIAVTGYRGQGKTTFCSYLTAHAKYVLGMNVWHNGALSPKYFPDSQIEIEELIDLDNPKFYNSLVFIDEIQTIMASSRSNTILSFLFNSMLTQLRKRKLVLLFTTQNYESIAGSLRWQVDFRVETKFVKESDLLLFMIQSQGTMFPFGLTRKGRVRKISTFFKYFDTEKTIGSMASIMMTSDTIRQTQDQQNKNKIAQCIEELKQENFEEIDFQSLANYVKARGIEVTDNKLGSMVGRLGFPKSRRNGVLYYILM